MDADAVLHPRGPLPPGVYWRRRLLTLLAVVVVLFLLTRACGSDGSPTASVSPSPSPSASATKTRAPRASKPAAKPSASASATATPGGQCKAADLVVNARADGQAFPGGRRPVLTIGVANKGAAACTYDVGQANREIIVMSGNDRVWSSDHCSPGGSPEITTLQPGAEPVTFNVTWARKRSAQGCPAGAQEVPAGTYRVIGRFGQLLSEADSFTVS